MVEGFIYILRHKKSSLTRGTKESPSGDPPLKMISFLIVCADIYKFWNPAETKQNRQIEVVSYLLATEHRVELLSRGDKYPKRWINAALSRLKVIIPRLEKLDGKIKMITLFRPASQNMNRMNFVPKGKDYPHCSVSVWQLIADSK